MGGMGQFGMIPPRGLAPFRLEILTGPFLVGDMDRPLSLTYCPQFTRCDVFEGYKVHLFVL